MYCASVAAIAGVFWPRQLVATERRQQRPIGRDHTGSTVPANAFEGWGGGKPGLSRGLGGFTLRCLPANPHTVSWS